MEKILTIQAANFLRDRPQKILTIQAANFLRDRPQVSSRTRLVDQCCKSPVGLLPELLILSPSQFKEGEKPETSIVSLSRTTAPSFFLSSLLRPHLPSAKGGGCCWIQITMCWGGSLPPWEPGAISLSLWKAVMSPILLSYSSRG